MEEKGVTELAVLIEIMTWLKVEYRQKFISCFLYL